jgi:hypothetical protein
MSVESQAILAGHVAVEQIVNLLRAEIGGNVVVREMQRPEYIIIKFEPADGTWSAMHVFLESWAADDYAEAYKGPSTLMTAEYTPQNLVLMETIAAAFGGLIRRSSTEPWVALGSALI